MTATVGETRAFLARSYGVPHTLTTHYVIAADSPGGMRVITCCDGAGEAGELLAAALEAVSGKLALAPDSGSVIVGREDLRVILADAWPLTANPAALNRLAGAVGLLDQPAARTEPSAATSRGGDHMEPETETPQAETGEQETAGDGEDSLDGATDED